MKGGLKRKGKEKNKGQNSHIISRLSFWQNMIFKKRTLTDKLTSVQKVANRSDFSGKKLLRRSATASTPPSAVRSVCTVDGRTRHADARRGVCFFGGKTNVIRRPLSGQLSTRNLSPSLSSFLSLVSPFNSRNSFYCPSFLSGKNRALEFDQWRWTPETV